MEETKKAWARMMRYWPCGIFDWHETRELAELAIEESAKKLGPQVKKIQCVAYFPSEDE